MENVQKLKSFIKHFNKEDSSAILEKTLKNFVSAKPWVHAVFKVMEDENLVTNENLRKEIVMTFIENVKFEELSLPYWVMETGSNILYDDIVYVLENSDDEYSSANIGAWLSYMYDKYYNHE